MTTISSSVTGPITLTGTLNPLTVTGTGTVTATATGVDAIDGAAGTTWTVVNNGTISSSTGYGVSLAGAGVVSSTGFVTGKSGLFLRGGGTVSNTGSIVASGSTGSGIYMTGAVGTVTNGGTITGPAYGVELAAGGLVTNTGAINGGHNAIRVLAASGTVANSGLIATTAGDVIGIFAGGSVSNAVGGTIVSHATAGASVYITGTTGTVTNAGSIVGIDYAVDLGKGGNVTNAAGGYISGHRGVNIQGAAGTVSNSGIINGTTSFGVRLASGGQVTNAAGGSISGPVGVQIYSAAGTVTNDGTISGTSQAVQFTGTGANRLVVGSSAVFIGGITGSTATGSTNTLELAGGTGTISGLTGGAGTVTENAHSWAIKNFTSLALDAGGAWTLSGNNTIATIVDNGTIDLTGSLTVTSAIDATSSGLFQLDGKTLEVAAATGNSTQISFLGGSQLTIDNIASFGTGVGTGSYAGPLLENFAGDDRIDLKTFSLVGLVLNYNATTGVLQVSNSASQVASLAFQTASLGVSTFQAATDAVTGIFITGMASTVTERLVNDTGASATDNVTSDPALAGTAGANAAVTLKEGTIILGSTTANAAGVWTFNPTGLSQGAHTVLASETNGSATLSFILDTAAPVITEALANDTGVSGDNITTDASLTGSGDPNAVVALKEGATVLGNTTANASGTWSFTPSTLSQGTHTIIASETDPAGNTGSTSLTFTYDSAAQAVTEKLVSDTGASATDNITSNPALTGTADTNAVVTLKEGITTLGTTTANAAGAWTFTPTGLSQGAHSILASEASGSATLTFTLDSIAPPVTEALANDTGTPGDNITSNPALTGSGDPNAVVTLKEGSTALGTATANASGIWAFTPSLSQGSHTVVASETDVAGNTGSASLTFTLTGTATGGGTISSSVTGPIILTGTLNPLTITSTGTVTSTASGKDAIDGASGTVWNVVNSGTIKSSTGYGVSLAGAGIISSSGLITGKGGLTLRGGGSVANTGSIGASGAVGGGSSNGSGVFMTGAAGTVTNGGIITGGAYGVALDAGGLVTNTSTIIGGEDGVRITGATGTVINSGSIVSTVDDGIGIFAGGSVSNAVGASIANQGTKGAAIYITGKGGTVTNSGRITGIDYAIDLAQGGTVTNNAGAYISSQRGVNIQGGSGVVSNSGTIAGTTSFGVRLSSGGQVTNATGGTISGPLGVAVYSAAGTVTNNGTISGTSHAVTFGGSGANRLVAGPTAVFIGNVVGSTATGSTNTLEFAGGSGTISGLTGGAGTITENAHSWSIKNFTTLAVDTGGAWTLSGNNSIATILDNGTIDLTGSLTVTSSIDPGSTGVFQLDSKSLEVTAALGSKTQISFLGTSQLTVDNVASFGTGIGTGSYAGPLLENFGTDDKVDLKSFNLAGAALNYNASTGVLQVSNSAAQIASLTFQTSSLGGNTFHVASDAASGILITHI